MSEVKGTQTLIVYSSVHGQTRRICQYLERKLVELGEGVTLCQIQDDVSLAAYDKVIIGASIRHGKHNPAVYEFIERNQDELDTKMNGFFSVSLVARKPAKNTADTNPYMQAFLTKTNWKPKLLEVFGGNLNYQGYGAMDRNIIRFIMWITKGPTDPNTCVEYTDWEKVDNFAMQIHSK